MPFKRHCQSNCYQYFPNYPYDPSCIDPCYRPPNPCRPACKPCRPVCRPCRPVCRPCRPVCRPVCRPCNPWWYNPYFDDREDPFEQHPRDKNHCSKPNCFHKGTLCEPCKICGYHKPCIQCKLARCRPCSKCGFYSPCSQCKGNKYNPNPCHRCCQPCLKCGHHEPCDECEKKSD